MTAPSTTRPLVSRDRRRIRILFADDSFVARESIASFLRSLAHVDLYAVCENGRAAVEHALREQPDVALLDLQMPVMSGLEAVQIFRSCLPRTAVIITTMHDHPEVRSACLAGGADAFVPKDRLAREFESALQSALAAAGASERMIAPRIDDAALTRRNATRAPQKNFPAGTAETPGSAHGSALPRGELAPPFRRDP